MSPSPEPQKPDWEHTQWHLAPPEKPSPWYSRWGMILLATAVGAFLGGIAYGAWPYIDYFLIQKDPHDYRYKLAQEAVDTDTHAKVHTRFLIGATLGTLLSATFAIATTAPRKRTAKSGTAPPDQPPPPTTR